MSLGWIANRFLQIVANCIEIVSSPWKTLSLYYLLKLFLGFVFLQEKSDDKDKDDKDKDDKDKKKKDKDQRVFCSDLNSSI